MRIFNIIVMLLAVSKLLSQPLNGKIHFKSEGKSNNFAAMGYIVNCLTLNRDSSFIWHELIFNDKKERKECIPTKYNSNEGRWSRSGDTIICYIKTSKKLEYRIERFYYTKNELFYFTYPIKSDFLKARKNFGWKKVKTLNSDQFFK